MDKINYFPSWLSGFIEAEGNFSLILYESGSIKKCSFNIGQNKDKFILEKIKNYFNCSHIIILEDKTKIKKLYTHYRIGLSGSKFREILINHFNQYPLLGDKQLSYLIWINYFISRGKL